MMNRLIDKTPCPAWMRMVISGDIGEFRIPIKRILVRNFRTPSFAFWRWVFLTAFSICLLSCITTYGPPVSLGKDVRDPPPSSDITLNFDDQGKGSPILFLHGFGASMYSYRNLVPALSKSFRVIRVDLKGFGNSPKPNDKNYSIDEQSSLIYQFIIQHNLKHLTIVGHSYGGAIALIVALKLNEEKADRLASLILIDSMSYPQPLPTFIRVLQTPILGALALYVISSKQQALSILKLAYYEDDKITKEAVEAYAAPLNSSGAHNALLQTAKEIIPSNINDIAAMYKNLRVSILILWGRHDKIVPLEIGKRLHKDLLNSEFIVLENTGHIPQEESPDETLKAISGFFRNPVKPKPVI
jgi:pimeloyl-ACP methyl ester carboxylesterase